MATEVKLPEFKDDICGEVRKLGTLPISRAANDRLKRMLRTIRPVDPKMWVEFEHDPGPIKIKDQDGAGACNGHACATSAEWSRKSSRMTHVDLSAWYPYAIMCNGVDQGSMIDQALEVATSNGIAPESEVKYGIIDPRQLTSAAHLAAKDFRVEAGEMIANFDEMMYATQRFLFGDFSIRVGANFNELDEEGVVGYSPGMGNHAVTFGLGAKRLTKGRYAGEWALKFQNSWSAKWGKGGYGWLVRRHIDPQRYYQAYTVYAVQDRPGDPTNPKRKAA